MSLLLNIDTATEHASICISRGDSIVAITESTEQKNHASFVQPAIEKLLRSHGLSLAEINAVSVTIGPGSYTGLRVGLASAKGICFALDKPLIAVNTLQVMAQAASDYCHSNSILLHPDTLFCPLIDARRMEVFTALYNATLHEIQEPYALIIDELSFRDTCQKQPTIFSGSGRLKLQATLTGPNAKYIDTQHNASHMIKQALKAYQSGYFADLAYCEPLYVKEFFDPSRANG